jgi:hypothetical protein
MSVYFDKGKRAARMELPIEGCPFTGKDLDEWVRGYKSYVPIKKEYKSAEQISEEFARKHFKND